MFYTIGLRDLPFEQDPRQIIYTEGQYNPTVNDFIVRNYERLVEKAKQFSREFCYIPYIQKQLLADEAIKNYYAPYPNRTERKKPLGNDIILDYMDHPENKLSIPPMLLFYNPDWLDDECYSRFQYRGVSLDLPDDFFDLSPLDKDKKIWDAFSEAIFRTTHEVFCDRMEFPDFFLEDEDELPADYRFDSESKKLIKEIQERVDRLHQKGISEEILSRILHRSNKLSRLVITKDKKILLPDYGMEIKLPALPKAVYILFLRHLEGIPFKHLPSYRKELSKIYEELRHGPLSEREKQSVDDVTNPLNNSINEKCARIREAFLSKFDEHLARRYYIDGKRGEPKLISLPKNFIEWE